MTTTTKTRRFTTKRDAEQFAAEQRALGRTVAGPFKTLTGYAKVTGRPMNEFAVDVEVEV